MTSIQSDSPHVSSVAATDDLRTIMVHDISWGAVFAGAVMAIVLQLILNKVGVGIAWQPSTPSKAKRPAHSP
jgi:hypothetical protein